MSLECSLLFEEGPAQSQDTFSPLKIVLYSVKPKRIRSRSLMLIFAPWCASENVSEEEKQILLGCKKQVEETLRVCEAFHTKAHPRPDTSCGGAATFLVWSNITISIQFKRFREALKKKLRDYLGIFPKRRTPPTPPFWEPLVQNEKFWVISWKI